MTEYLPTSVVYHFFNVQLRLHQFQLQNRQRNRFLSKWLPAAFSIHYPCNFLDKIPVPGVHPLQWYELKVVILEVWSLHSANALGTLELSIRGIVKADLQCKPCRSNYWLLVLHSQISPIKICQQLAD